MNRAPTGAMAGLLLNGVALQTVTELIVRLLPVSEPPG